MANCPLCTDVLLRHIRSGQTYWFCRRCRVEIAEPSEQAEQTSFPITIELAHLEVEDPASFPQHHAGSEGLLPQTTPGLV